MDVPETGAVFAFGRSHLTITGDGNDNNYFFVKRDPVKRLISGRNQSAVICESGRLFVWGENSCGQLAIGTCENIITKPSCVKEIKKLGQTVKDFQYGSNFSVLLTDSNKIFYAGKNIFPFNAKIDSLDGRFQHDISEMPIELEEYEKFDEPFEFIRAADEHFVVVTENRKKLIGWGFNSHHQLATIDSQTVLTMPDVFFQTDDEERIKFMECGKLSTCVVTEYSDLYIVGRFHSITISTFTKIREPISNSIITQLHISDDDEIYLVTESGFVYKSNDFRNIIDLRFDELKVPKIDEKIVKIAPGNGFVSIMTEHGRCYSLLKDDKELIESGKLKRLQVIDIDAGAEHVLVSTKWRSEDVNGNDQMLLNKTYTINFKPIKELGSGEDNYQEPDTGEKVPVLSLNCEDVTEFEKNDDDIEIISLTEMDGATRLNTCSRATTLECKDTDSSGHSSAPKQSPECFNSSIRFIDNGIDKTRDMPVDTPTKRQHNGSVRIMVHEDYKDEHESVHRKKTPMPTARGRVKPPTQEDLDEHDIIDRDEDLYNDDDDVSTNSTMHEETDDSLEEYIKEENKVNEENSQDVQMKNGKIKRWIQDIRSKGKGLSCNNSDSVIRGVIRERDESFQKPNVINSNNNNNPKSCLIM